MTIFESLSTGVDTMNNKNIEEIISLTRKCLVRYWQNDYEFALNYFDKDIIWIGATKEQFMQGIETVRADFEKVSKELKPCHMLNQQFLVADRSGNGCTIAGRYLVTTDNTADIILQAQQRCTFVWKIYQNKPKIVLCHISNPIGEMKLCENESFPNQLGKTSFDYLNLQIENAKNTTNTLNICDTKGAIRFISPSEIEYAESNKRTVTVHTLEETFEAKIKWNDFLNNMEKYLIQVHRNYAINRNYISLIGKQSIVMKSGDHIPIPLKKSNTIIEKIINENNL